MKRYMMKRAFTLIELIITIAISAILAVGTFKAIEAIAVRAKKAKILAQMTLDTQATADQIAQLLYDRIPESVIVYRPNSDFQPLEYNYDEDSNYTILEWIGRAREVENNCSSMFIDLSTVSDDRYRFKSKGETNGDRIESIIETKYALSSSTNIYEENIINLIYPARTNDVKTSFGWHGTSSDDSYDIDNISSTGEINISNSEDVNNSIYAIFYLVDTAYALARGADVNTSHTCFDYLKGNITLNENTLYLFYNYRPWRGETFCGDKNTLADREGNVTVLMQNVTALEAHQDGVAIRIKIDSFIDINGHSKVHISKQKVIF